MSSTEVATPGRPLGRDPLSVLGEADDARVARQVRIFTTALLCYVTVQSLDWIVRAGADGAGELVPQIAASSVWLALCAIASGAGRRARVVALAALPIMVVQASWQFPSNSNHFWLSLTCVGLVAGVGDRTAADRGLLLHALRAVAVVVLFHTGSQKLLHGWFFRGEFLAFAVAHEGHFADFFRLLLPAAELARLEAIDLDAVGAGPFRVDAWPFVLASNASMVGELVLPAFLVWPRTRTLAAIAGIAMVGLFQLAAREFLFFSLFSLLLLLFPARPWLRGALAAWIVAWTLLLAMSVGWLPDGGLLRGPGML